LLHGARYGITPPIKVDRSKYSIGNHTDLYPLLAGPAPFAKGKLEFFAQYYLGRKKTEGMDGCEVQSAWNMCDYSGIQKYCEEDTVLTWDLCEIAEKGGLTEI